MLPPCDRCARGNYNSPRSTHPNPLTKVAAPRNTVVSSIFRIRSLENAKSKAIHKNLPGISLSHLGRGLRIGRKIKGPYTPLPLSHSANSYFFERK
jgi:hypothetical protein